MTRFLPAVNGGVSSLSTDEYAVVGGASATIEIRIFIEHEDDGIIDQRYMVNESGSILGRENEEEDYEYTFHSADLTESGWYSVGIEAHAMVTGGPKGTVTANIHHSGDNYAEYDKITVDL